MTLSVHFETECGPLEYPLADSKDKFSSGEVFLTVINIFRWIYYFPLEKGVAITFYAKFC